MKPVRPTHITLIFNGIQLRREKKEEELITPFKDTYTNFKDVLSSVLATSGFDMLQHIHQLSKIRLANHL